jgi:hypothetical protein
MNMVFSDAAVVILVVNDQRWVDWLMMVKTIATGTGEWQGGLALCLRARERATWHFPTMSASPVDLFQLR